MVPLALLSSSNHTLTFLQLTALEPAEVVEKLQTLILLLHEPVTEVQ